MSKEFDLGGFKISEDDIIMLESLIKSPAFAALKRALAVHRASTLSILMSSTDLAQIHQSQGRIIGLDMIEHLPAQILESKRKVEILEKQAKNFKPKVTVPRNP